MNTTATLTEKDLESRAFLLGDIVNRFSNLLGKQDNQQLKQVGDSYTQFSQAFAATEFLPKSLLVVRTKQDISGDLETTLAVFLQQVFSDHAMMTKVGDRELALMLLGYEQFGDLKPCIERINAELAQRDCENTVGVARCPLDDHELPQLIAMASAAAAELETPHSYQFISRRHRHCGLTVH